MEIDHIKILSKSALVILTEYIDLISSDLYNLIDYMHTDKYKTYCDLSKIIADFTKDNIDKIKEINLPINNKFSVHYYDLCIISSKLNDFKMKCETVIKDNESFYSKFLNSFGFNSNVPMEIVICSLYKNYSFIHSVLKDDDMRNELTKFFSSIEANYNCFMVEYFSYKKTQSFDDVSSYASLAVGQRIEYEQVDAENLLHNKKVVYIDQNIISEYCSAKNKKLRSLLNSLKEKGEYVFVFSPYLVEDGIKMDYVYFNLYLAQVLKLTNGIFISKVDNEICYVKEDFDTLVSRVIEWLPATSVAENIKYYEAKLNYFSYPFVRKDSRIVSKINEDISGFFMDIESTKNIIINDRNVSFFDFLQSVLWNITNQFDLEDMKAGRIRVDKDYDYVEIIERVSKFLDVINYKTERIRDKKKILSSYQDVLHLAHAWKADYFLTNDDRLIERGSYIYGLLGVKTKFIKDNELADLK
ncbi:hypothetical protein ACI2Q1_003641 [Salmonella enterica subsp. enterica]